MSEPRFILIQPCEEFPDDGETSWYFDTQRQLITGDRPFIAVQVYRHKDPNQFVQVDNLRLLFTDQAEYYAVCPSCHGAFSHMQWSGSTRFAHWREKSQEYLVWHQANKGWCEFCDPVFGNGGWSRD